MDKTKPRTSPEDEEQFWRDYSAERFLRGYGDDEPEYTEADIIEVNPDYKPRSFTDKPRP
jgi:hypothetical protein